ncbi:hypothetical protein HOP50_09g56690 [Chloropicon primus]|uniref:Uncharacterized protein n=1 Tax=Chloropicon primus TaxID=1764295 RepID=A0A5B8MRC6_9CHLO|nr:hypothetical protein A3770_09p56470 [Chloropicon primus]UPR02343.1 hypothetical protein HOP50_09g56690 [Chloropicon primus]|eukprot:QDZ23129.1 hypothetical protein A3770_09p56470 [Chloropicon primus]
MAGAMKALKAERERYRRELEEYRKEAAQAFRGQNFVARNVPSKVDAVVERPGKSLELEGILTEAVQKSQSRRLAPKKKKAKPVAMKSSDAIWKDVSNVLDSSEKHLHVAEKYFKRVFDVIRDPDRLAKGEPIWKDEDENDASLARAEDASVASTSPSAQSASGIHPEATASPGGQAFESFQPIVIDHTRKGAREDEGAMGTRGSQRPLVQREAPGPSTPKVHVRREDTFLALQGQANGEAAKQSTDDAVAGTSETGEEVPSTATEIRKKAQEFLVELELLQNLGANLQTKVAVPFKTTDSPPGPPERTAESTQQPAYVSVGSSPIVKDGRLKAGEAERAGSEQEVSSSSGQESSAGDLDEDSQSGGPAKRSSRREARKGRGEPPQGRPNFFSDVLKTGGGQNAAAARDEEVEERRSSFALQQERADAELYKKLGIDSYDTVAMADRIVSDSSLAPAAQVVERLLGGEYDYKGQHLECAVASQKLERIKARIRKPSKSMTDFETSYDQFFQEGTGLHEDAEAPQDFITSTIDDLFSGGGSLTAGHQPSMDETLVSDFYDIPKRLQRLAAKNFVAPVVTKPVARQETKLPVQPQRPISQRSEGRPHGNVSATLASEEGPVDGAVDSARMKDIVDEGTKVKASASSLLMQLKDNKKESGAVRESPFVPKKGALLQRNEEKAQSQGLREPLEAQRGREETRARARPQQSSSRSKPSPKPKIAQEGSVSSDVSGLSTSSAAGYDKSKYQSKKLPKVADAPSEIARTTDLESRLKKLEESMERNNQGQASQQPSVAKVVKSEPGVDSQVQTDPSELQQVEQSVQTDTPPKPARDAADQAEEEALGLQLEKEGQGGEEPEFEEVCDVDIEDIAPQRADTTQNAFEMVSLKIEGESEEPPPAVPSRYTMKEIQTQFKQEITLDNVVEEILGRFLSEDLERELAQETGGVSSEDIARVVQGEISKMYKSSKATARETVEYSDEFNEMFLAHALLASLTQAPQETEAEELIEMENLDFTDDPTAKDKPERPPTPIRSAWGEEGETQKTSFTESAPARPATSTKCFDSSEDSTAAEDHSSSDSFGDSPPPYYSAGSTDSSDGGGVKTPPTPATPRNFEEVISSVESKLRVFDAPGSAKGGDVVRKLDLQQSSESSEDDA